MMWGYEGGNGKFPGPLCMVLTLASTIAAIALVVRWLSGARQGFWPAGPTLPVQTPIKGVPQ